ncbi:MAG TPA: NTP transferase domain-containing protein [Fimbriimonadaceae bacterium]
MVEVDVIIPAGGTINAAFARVVGTDNKALITLEGNTVLGNTIQCLRNTPGVRRIAVIGDEKVERAAGNSVDQVLSVEETGPQNIFKGLRWLQSCHAPADNVLIVTSDLPFVTADVFKRFLDICPTGKDFCVPLIAQDEFSERFPGAEATYVKMRDGTWTTGCAYLSTPKGLFNAIQQIEEVFKNRKSKIGIARMLGPRFVWGYVTKSLTVADVEKKVRALLNCAAVAVPDSPAELAYDIDYIEDYHYALQTLKLKQEPSSRA